MRRFRNVKTCIDGIKFDSRGESRRYLELKSLQSDGIISNLKLQVKFQIADSCIINGKKRPARNYVADFVYDLGGKQIVEDFKGLVTPMYSLKRHLMKSVNGIDILETFDKR